MNGAQTALCRTPEVPSGNQSSTAVRDGATSICPCYGGVVTLVVVVSETLSSHFPCTSHGTGVTAYVSPILRHVSQVLSISHSFPAVAVPTVWFKPCFLCFAGGDSLPAQPWGGMRQCVSCCCLPRFETLMELATGKRARAFQSGYLKESWLMESIIPRVGLA